MKIITKLMAGLCLVSLSYMPSQAQQFQSHEQLMRNLLEVQQINAMNGALPQNHSSKTTSLDRALISIFKDKRTDKNTWIDHNYDSTAYTNISGKHSEFNYDAFNYWPDDHVFYNDISGHLGIIFAAEKWKQYKADSSRSYTLSRSDSIHYDADGKMLFYKQGQANGDYTLFRYTYGATGRRIRTIESAFDASSSSFDYIDTTLHRYGTGYIVSESPPGTFYDSIIFDNDGRVGARYHDSILYTYEYDADGYFSLVKTFTYSGVLRDSTVYNFNSDYRRYSFDYYRLANGNITIIVQQKLIGQSGLLDSVQQEGRFVSTGNIITYLHEDVSLDSYGNVSQVDRYDMDGFMTEIIRYQYEDVDLSTERPLAFTGFKVFPNPATSDVLHISTTEKYNSLALYNTDGQLLMQTHFEPRTESQITLSDLAPGSYVVTVRSDEGRQSSQTIVVQR